jgi:hypothetical protein
MEKDQCDRATKIGPEKAVELLFNDSSKNISDLKSRQWNAANYGVLAIMAVAVFVAEHGSYRRMAAWIMVLIVLCHVGVTLRCSSNLRVFRDRLKTLVSCYFPAEFHELFEKKTVPANSKKLPFPRGSAGQDFEDAIVDEGLISIALLLSTPVTFLFALYIVHC